MADVSVFREEADVAKAVSEFVIGVANKSISERGVFTIGLSGGSVSKYLSTELPGQDTDWSKWKVFFCDERHVGYDDSDCTYSFYKANLFDKVAIPAENIYPDNPSVSVHEAADEYAKKIQSCFGGASDIRFDLLILGMGPDGHTCSLFPGHSLLQESEALVRSISDSPKPPPERITMTYRLINNARTALFASCGQSKADVLKRVLEGNEVHPLPAARVKLSDGKLRWFLDEGAASKLTKKQ